ncbi:unnamed protein product, partial [Anisakis simplex]|uniref:beta-mannosidase n=1 Tax=Anisakis simplex TaxID=6269 RepID=A0A0M3J4J8_ANISI
MKTFTGLCIATASALFLIESSSVFAASSISVSKIEHHSRLSNEHFDLNSLAWTFRNENASIKGRATVPGDIYTDLFNNNFIGNPLNANNDEKLRWIARLDWIYECEFYLPERWKMFRSVLLNAQGLDTVASVYLNEWKILRSNNQFHTFLVPLESWRVGRNSIRIHFKSPIHYAKRQSNEYHVTSHHDIPPICPPSIYRGDCHINFMRKIQSSFAWDWGPTFPTVGIWQAISLE